jgi:hypothetical protein
MVTGFHLQASNGYGFLALAGEAPLEGDEGWVGLFLVRGDRHAAVTYAAPVTVTRETIDADLGKLGRISVVRVPTGRTRTAHLVCGSESTQRVKAERYEGTIEFHGEEGFTEVDATGAPLVYLLVASPREDGPLARACQGLVSTWRKSISNSTGLISTRFRTDRALGPRWELKSQNTAERWRSIERRGLGQTPTCCTTTGVFAPRR